MAGRTVRCERGATAVEYGLLILLVTGMIFALVLLFGGDVLGLFTSTADSVDDAVNNP